MRKFYLFFMTAVMMMVGVLSANAIKITLKVDRPEAVVIKVNYVPMEGEVQAVNELDVAEYAYVEVAAKDGYKVKSVTDNAGNAVGYLYSTWSITIYPSNEDAVYNVATQTMEEYRDCSCFITVDVADNVTVQRNGTWTYVDNLKNGERVEVFFNQAEELPLYISSTTGKSLYEVKQNGVKVEGSSIRVSPAKGDEIVITSQYPDKDCQITFELPEGCEDFFTSVKAEDREMGSKYYEGFTMKAGENLYLTGNTTDYKFNSMTIGSETINYFNGRTQALITDDTKIVVNVAKYKTLNATISIDNTNAATVLTNQYDTTSGLVLANGENAVEISETITQLFMKPNTGYYVTKLTVNGEDVMESSYVSYNKMYQINVTDGMKVAIETAKITYDNKMVVYVNMDPASMVYFSFTNTDREEYTLKQGYNVIDFSTTQNPFMWSWYDNGNDGLVYINDVLTQPTYEGTASFQDKQIKDGDVVKLFIHETTEKSYNVTFEGDTQDAVITKDIITPVESAEAQTVLPGTRFTFEAVEGKDIVVTANGEELTPAYGVFTIDVNADTQFKVTANTADGVNAVSSLNARAIYNLQGVRMNGKNLPAGMYIINGKSVMIK